MLYRQCTLVKGDKSQVAWVHDKYSVVGKTLGFRENDVWDEGWVVHEVGNTAMKGDYLNERSRDYTRLHTYS